MNMNILKSETKQLPGIWTSSPLVSNSFLIFSCLALKKNSSKVVHFFTFIYYNSHFSVFPGGERGFFFLITKKQLRKTGPGLGGSGGEGTGSPLGCGVVISNPSRCCCWRYKTYISLWLLTWDWWKLAWIRQLERGWQIVFYSCLTKLFPWNDGE